MLLVLMHGISGAGTPASNTPVSGSCFLLEGISFQKGKCESWGICRSFRSFVDLQCLAICKFLAINKWIICLEKGAFFDSSESEQVLSEVWHATPLSEALHPDGDSFVVRRVKKKKKKKHQAGNKWPLRSSKSSNVRLLPTENSDTSNTCLR